MPIPKDLPAGKLGSDRKEVQIWTVEGFDQFTSAIFPKLPMAVQLQTQIDRDCPYKYLVLASAVEGKQTGTEWTELRTSYSRSEYCKKRPGQGGAKQPRYRFQHVHYCSHDKCFGRLGDPDHRGPCLGQFYEAEPGFAVEWNREESQDDFASTDFGIVKGIPVSKVSRKS